MRPYLLCYREWSFDVKRLAISNTFYDEDNKDILLQMKGKALTPFSQSVWRTLVEWNTKILIHQNVDNLLNAGPYLQCAKQTQISTFRSTDKQYSLQQF